jgi:hypothetical protein
MPRSGIANGCADFVLPVRDLAKRDFRAKPRRCDLWPAAAHQHCRDTLKSRLITSRRPGAWTAGDPDRRRSGGSGSPLKGGAQRRNCVTRPLQVGWLSSRPAPPSVRVLPVQYIPTSSRQIEKTGQRHRGRFRALGAL